MKLLLKTLAVFLVMLAALCGTTVAVFSMMVSAHTATTGGAFIIPLASLMSGAGSSLLCGYVAGYFLKMW